MNWVDALDNPQAIRSLFRDVSALGPIELHEVLLDREGSVLRLRFDVPAVPSSMPRKWPKEANTTQFTLAAWGVGAVQLSGWVRLSPAIFRFRALERKCSLNLPVSPAGPRRHSLRSGLSG